MTTKIFLSALILMLILTNASAQSNNIGIKFNGGFVASSPKDDFRNGFGNGHDLQPFVSLEGSYHISYTQNTKYGFKLAVVAGEDWANFLAADAISQIDVSVANARLRFYPLSYSGEFWDGLGALLPENLPFLVDIPVWIGIYSVFNSLHFDYGIGAANFRQYSFLDDENYPVSSVKRTLSYMGWGVQPIIYQSENQKWSFNGIFTFGKYSWKNSGGTKSSFSSNQLGFGVQYHL